MFGWLNNKLRLHNYYDYLPIAVSKPVPMTIPRALPAAILVPWSKKNENYKLMIMHQKKVSIIYSFVFIEIIWTNNQIPILSSIDVEMLKKSWGKNFLSSLEQLCEPYNWSRFDKKLSSVDFLAFEHNIYFEPDCRISSRSRYYALSLILFIQFHIKVRVYGFRFSKPDYGFTKSEIQMILWVIIYN